MTFLMLPVILLSTLTSNLWQQLQLPSELESRKTRKTQFVSFDHSKDFDTIDEEMDGSL